MDKDYVKEFDKLIFNQPDDAVVEIVKNQPTEYSEIGARANEKKLAETEDILTVWGLTCNGKRFLLKITGKCFGWEFSVDEI